MEKRTRRSFFAGATLLLFFAVWTVLVQTVDVKVIGETGTPVGFAGLNGRFHQRTGVHMWLYTLTDWLGLVPVAVCLLFGGMGLSQAVKRKGLRKVDHDLIILGLYYVLVIICYLAFEMFPVNYRPILIEGRVEASYPSSTTLLVLSVMPTLVFQAKCRWGKDAVLTRLFSLLMVFGRLLSGVHWLTDIVGSVLLSGGLFLLYRAAVLAICKGSNRGCSYGIS